VPQKIEKEMPSLVVLDVVMERMNGFETLREIRDNPKTKRLPVVICSTKSTDLGADA
jgi:CheY-like chemotaxis protein